jgi:hypothetical protein
MDHSLDAKDHAAFNFLSKNDYFCLYALCIIPSLLYSHSSGASGSYMATSSTILTATIQYVGIKQPVLN